LQVTLCDPYLSALEAFAWTRYTNRRLLYFTYFTVFHGLTRTAYLYNGCLLWYNVALTSRVHSSVKYSQQSQLRTRATVE